MPPVHASVAAYLGIGRSGKASSAGARGDQAGTATVNDAQQHLGAPRPFRFPIPIKGATP